MYKLISLVKRKPGLTKQQFKEYYENHHTKLGEKFLPPYCVKYSRRYLDPIVSPMKPDNEPGPDFDCQVDLWFIDEANYRAFEASVASAPPEEIANIVADEENFCDRAQTVRYVVDEHISWEPAITGKVASC